MNKVERANGTPLTVSQALEQVNVQSELRMIQMVLDARLGELGDALSNMADTLREIRDHLEQAKPRTILQRLGLK
jgi:hypothetical protein